MVDVLCNRIMYKTPSNAVLTNRKMFYGLQRKRREPIEQWLKRIQNCIDYCKYPSTIEFLLIDKFVCGLNKCELEIIQSAQNWTLKQLLEHFLIENTDFKHSETNSTINEYIISNEIISLDVLKFEPNEEESPQNDPFSEADLTTVANSLSDTEATGNRFALNKPDIDSKMLIDGMKIKCEDYEYSANDATTGEFNDDDSQILLNYPFQNQSNPNRDYACDLCDKSFNHASNLSKHKRTMHREILSHVCKECGKRFAFVQDLNNHLINHTGEKRYCDLCDKSFSYSSSLKKHKRSIHQRLRAFACQLCGKRFFSAFELKRHSRSHTGEKPYSCEECDQSFTQSYDLVKHKKTVHQKIRSFACQMCNKRYSTAVGLKRHSTVHTRRN